MLKKIISLSEKFVSIKSDPDNREALEHILELAVSQLTDFTIERFEDHGLKSVLIYYADKRPKKFKIILNGHLDVIPGKEYQYTPLIKGNRLYGVGSMDMKSNVACLIMAFKEVAKTVDYPLGLQLVTDEEIGGFHGTKYQIDQGVRADFVIAGETTNFNIVNKAKGVLLLKISCRGKTAHGAYPWRGKNAIWKMQKFLALLGEKYPVPNEQVWETTINLSTIETSNTSFNKIPDDCAVNLDIRYIPEESNSIVNDLKALLPKGFKMEIIAQEPALLVDKNNQYLKILQKMTAKMNEKNAILYGAQGTSDARHFTRVGCAGVEFGPIGGGIGTDKEWVDIPSLQKYYEILKEFLIHNSI